MASISSLVSEDKCIMEGMLFMAFEILELDEPRLGLEETDP